MSWRTSGGKDDLPENCIVCGKPTRSHPVPAGWLCHTCLQDKDVDVILDELSVSPVPDADADTSLPCYWCESEYTLREAHTPGRATTAVIVGETPFDRLNALIVVSCPKCTRATEFLTTVEAAENIIEELGVPYEGEVNR